MKKVTNTRQKRLKKKRDILLKILTPREKRLKKKRNILLNKKAAVMKNRLTGKKAKKKIEDKVKYIKKKKYLN